MSDIITLPVNVAKVETRRDRSFKITVESLTELDPLEATILFSMANKTGYMAFSESAVKKEAFEGLPEIEPEVGQKSPATRLRGVLFLLWEKTGKHGDFEIYYKVAIERLIDNVKEKLN